ncbi:hypothetical protein BG011_005028 [Mortierella polycephala]|uniref:VASt domain-containing protein n=1 Tax=Mortierella polycephala TaxID=41804 RepID=A0A9P6QFD1_9FUNG|nr:hypothetical protein BG011_005028 [Mortierella polycephala]
MPSSPALPTTRPNRKPAFSLGLSWRSQSEYSNNGASGLQSRLTKPQRRFIRAFPELADLVMVPSAYCAPCLMTPPQTPSDTSSEPLSASMSTSNTLNTLVSTSDYSTSASNSTLTCQGHFNDFTCALELEVLWQGTLYVTATHVCFYGKRFGKTVKVMVDYQDLVSIEREKKMGVFPSSIRIRVKKLAAMGDTGGVEDRQDTMAAADNIDGYASATVTSTKDYVLTSLVSREQAFADIERNWAVHRQVMKSLSTSASGLESPLSETLSEMDRGLSMDRLLGLDRLDHPARTAGCLRSRRKAPRTYSVISDEAFSSTENVDRLGLRERLSSNRLRPSTSVSTPVSASGPTVVYVAAADDPAKRLSSMTDDSPSSDSRRGSMASSTSSEKQESSAAGLKAFILSQRKNRSKMDRTDSISVTESSQEDMSSHTSDDNYLTTTEAISSPIAVQATRSTSSILSGSHRSSTPPPTLISPSLTTTKVSHSSSTVQSISKAGGFQGMTKHTRKESDGVLLDNAEDEAQAAMPLGRSGSGALRQTVIEPESAGPAPVRLPTEPVLCGCTRHYKNTILSTVIPLPLNLCFEILFSSMGAGQDGKLCCDTHRIKDGSTEIKITPWQGEALVTCVRSPAWESRTRYLEYSVSFKVPMLAKTSTACFETQQVTHYSDFVILVHSESRTPNVPYGEHFSTVNQICMTWEAPGKTRIQCFTEVKFKKSVMWSSKVESGSLEGSGGFYKEFIRQLGELADAQGKELIQQSLASQAAAAAAPASDPAPAWSHPQLTTSAIADTTATSSQPPMPIPSNVTPVSVVAADNGHDSSSMNSSSTNTDDQAGPSVLSRVTHTPMRPMEMSRAQSLLSQQIRRNPSVSATVAQSKGVARLSLDSARPPHVETSSVSQMKDQLTPTLPSEKKSALSAFMQSLTPPGFPINTVAAAALTMETNKIVTTDTADCTVKEALTGPSTGPSADSSPLAPSVWSGLVRKSLAVFDKGFFYSAATTTTTTTTTMTLDGNTTANAFSAEEMPSNRSINSSTSSKQASSTGTLVGSDDAESASRNMDKLTGARVTFATPSTSKSPSRTADGAAGSSMTCVSSSSSLSFSTKTKEQHQRWQSRSERPKYSFPKAIFGFVVLVMVVSAMNIWHLFNVLSSVVDVVQLGQGQIHHHHRIQQPSYHRHLDQHLRQDQHAWYSKHSFEHQDTQPPLDAIPSHTSQFHDVDSHREHVVRYQQQQQQSQQQPQQQPVDENTFDSLQSKTDTLRDEINELFVLLERARQELHQTTSYQQ